MSSRTLNFGLFLNTFFNLILQGFIRIVFFFRNNFTVLFNSGKQGVNIYLWLTIAKFNLTYERIFKKVLTSILLHFIAMAFFHKYTALPEAMTLENTHFQKKLSPTSKYKYKCSYLDKEPAKFWIKLGPSMII